MFCIGHIKTTHAPLILIRLCREHLVKCLLHELWVLHHEVDISVEYVEYLVLKGIYISVYGQADSLSQLQDKCSRKSLTMKVVVCHR